MHLDPCDGGCWFCATDDGEMLFSYEFDTYVHEECIKKNLVWPENPEAVIMAEEFGIDY